MMQLEIFRHRNNRSIGLLSMRVRLMSSIVLIVAALVMIAAVAAPRKARHERELRQLHDQIVALQNHVGLTQSQIQTIQLLIEEKQRALEQRANHGR
jgi:Tfp pilus assembly protein PilN